MGDTVSTDPVRGPAFVGKLSPEKPTETKTDNAFWPKEKALPKGANAMTDAKEDLKKASLERGAKIFSEQAYVITEENEPLSESEEEDPRAKLFWQQAYVITNENEPPSESEEEEDPRAKLFWEQAYVITNENEPPSESSEEEEDPRAKLFWEQAYVITDENEPPSESSEVEAKEDLKKASLERGRKIFEEQAYVITDENEPPSESSEKHDDGSTGFFGEGPPVRGPGLFWFATEE